MKKMYIFLLSFFGLSGIVNIQAQSGILDPVFGNQGLVLTSLGSNDDIGDVITTLPDGKILVAGHTKISDFVSDIILVRYYSNGSVDSSFANNGVAILDLVFPNMRSIAIGLQSGGKIIIAGVNSGISGNLILIRCRPNGSLDTNFGNNGTITTNLNGVGLGGKAMAVQSDDKILLCGAYSIPESFGVDRYLPNGELDTSFGNNGRALITFSVRNIANSLAIQSDGKIIVAGTSNDYFGPNYMTMARLQVDGVLDPTFNNNGKLEFPSNNSEEGWIVAVQPDGKIVFAGASFPGDGTSDFVLRRVNTNGSIDNSFGSNGLVQTSLEAANIERPYAMLIQPDSKIVVGDYSVAAPNKDFVLFRYEPNGMLDQSFGMGGIVSTDFSGSTDIGRGLALQQDGKLIYTGNAYAPVGANQKSHVAIARYFTGLFVQTVELEHLASETSLFPNPVQDWLTVEYTLSETKKISLDIYDMMGRRVSRLVDEALRSEGEHREQFLLSTSLLPGKYILVWSSLDQQLSMPLLKQTAN